MTDRTPEKLKAFLDDLALLSVKHGIYISTSDAEDRYDLPGLEFFSDTPRFNGYRACASSGIFFLASRPNDLGCEYVEGLDITQLSDHERLEILGARSHSAKLENMRRRKK